MSPGDWGPQLAARNGEIALRITGVKVFERHDPSGNPYAAYGDRETGTVVLLTVECVGRRVLPRGRLVVRYDRRASSH